MQTITTIDASWQDRIGSGELPSFNDYKMANLIYNCAGMPRLHLWTVLMVVVLAVVVIVVVAADVVVVMVIAVVVVAVLVVVTVVVVVVEAVMHYI